MVTATRRRQRKWKGLSGKGDEPFAGTAITYLHGERPASRRNSGARRFQQRRQGGPGLERFGRGGVFIFLGTAMDIYAGSSYASLYNS